MRIPDLRVQADVGQIKEILSNSPGIDRVVADYEAGIVEITTAAQDGGANAIEKLSRGGFPPSEIERVEEGNRGT